MNGHPPATVAILRGVKHACRDSGNDWGIVNAIDEWFRTDHKSVSALSMLRDAANSVDWHYTQGGDPDDALSYFADGRTDRQSANMAEAIAWRGVHWLCVTGASA